MTTNERTIGTGLFCIFKLMNFPVVDILLLILNFSQPQKAMKIPLESKRMSVTIVNSNLLIYHRPLTKNKTKNKTK